MNKIIPHLWFQEDALKVAEYYLNIFPDSRLVSQFALKDPFGGQVQVVKIELMSLELILFSAPARLSFNESFSLVVDCHTQEEIDHYWSALSTDGGKESMCGWLKDKYGLSWQIVPDTMDELMNDTDQERLHRVSEVILSSHKLEIKKIMKAYNNE